RRHTRLVSDWSSDVCSSDLSTRGRPLAAQVLGGVGVLQCLDAAIQFADEAPGTGEIRRGHVGNVGPNSVVQIIYRFVHGIERVRSEERRVGKEWRSR